MGEELRKSWAARATAIGFIIEILLGNVWFVFTIIGGEPPRYIMDGISLCAVYILFCAVWMGVTMFQIKQQPDDGSEHVE